MNQMQESILLASRALLADEGPRGLQMRKVAERCGLSVGSLYNAFGSKDALLQATVHAIWFDIFHPVDLHTSGILSYLKRIYENLQLAGERYPGFFNLHAMSLLGPKDEAHMTNLKAHIVRGLVKVLQADPSVDDAVFNETFTAEDLAKGIFSFLLASFIQETNDDRVLITLVARSLGLADD